MARAAGPDPPEPPPDTDMPIRIDSSSADFAGRFKAFLAMKREVAADIETAVRGIVGDVIARGDAALIEDIVSALEEHIVLGTLLTALVVLLFLKSLSSTLIIAAAIPVSLLGAAADGRVHRVAVAQFPLAVDVFQHHYGVVHHDADQQQQAEQRHRVEGEARKIHHGDRAQQGHRDGHGHNQGGTEAPQEPPQHTNRQEHTQYQVAADQGDRPVNEYRGVE